MVITIDSGTYALIYELALISAIFGLDWVRIFRQLYGVDWIGSMSWWMDWIGSAKMYPCQTLIGPMVTVKSKLELPT